MSGTGALAVKSALSEGGLTFVEQLHAASLQLCPNPFVPWLSGIDRASGKAILIRGACGLWSCKVCGARNGRRWLARLLNHMNKSKTQRWFFLTITAHEKWRGVDASVRNLRQGWKKLYNRMRRRYGCTEYAKVWEFHEDGSFHLHVLYGRKVGKRWLKDNSKECGMGYIVDSSASKNPGQCAGYAAKYLLKSFEVADRYPKGLRRIEVSRSWAKLPDLNENDDYNWVVSQTRAGQDRIAAALGSEIDIVDMRPSERKVTKIIEKGLNYE